MDGCLRMVEFLRELAWRLKEDSSRQVSANSSLLMFLAWQHFIVALLCQNFIQYGMGFFTSFREGQSMTVNTNGICFEPAGCWPEGDLKVDNNKCRSVDC